MTTLVEQRPTIRPAGLPPALHYALHSAVLTAKNVSFVVFTVIIGLLVGMLAFVLGLIRRSRALKALGFVLAAGGAGLYARQRFAERAQKIEAAQSHIRAELDDLDPVAKAQVLADKHGNVIVVDQGTLDLDCRDPMPRHVHHVVHTAEQPEVAVLVDPRPIAGEVRVVVPASRRARKELGNPMP